MPPFLLLCTILLSAITNVTAGKPTYIYHYTTNKGKDKACRGDWFGCPVESKPGICCGLNVKNQHTYSALVPHKNQQMRTSLWKGSTNDQCKHKLEPIQSEPFSIGYNCYYYTRAKFSHGLVEFRGVKLLQAENPAHSKAQQDAEDQECFGRIEPDRFFIEDHGGHYFNATAMNEGERMIFIEDLFSQPVNRSLEKIARYKRFETSFVES